MQLRVTQTGLQNCHGRAHGARLFSADVVQARGFGSKVAWFDERSRRGRILGNICRIPGDKCTCTSHMACTNQPQWTDPRIAGARIYEPVHSCAHRLSWDPWVEWLSQKEKEKKGCVCLFHNSQLYSDFFFCLLCFFLFHLLARSFKIFSASHPERLPSFSQAISSPFVLFFVSLLSQAFSFSN